MKNLETRVVFAVVQCSKQVEYLFKAEPDLSINLLYVAKLKPKQG